MLLILCKSAYATRKNTGAEHSYQTKYSNQNYLSGVLPVYILLQLHWSQMIIEEL